MFSAGLHGLLGIVLIGTSGFRDHPPKQDMLILTLIPSRILDTDKVNEGRATAPATHAPPRPEPPVAQPPVRPVVPLVQPPSRPQPRPAVIPPPEPERVERVERPMPKEVDDTPERPALLPKKVAKVRPPRRVHEVHPEFTQVTPQDRHKIAEQSAAAAAQAAERADASRREKITETFTKLAAGVESSVAKATVVNLPGSSGGAAFAGYDTVILNYYYRAWITPDSSVGSPTVPEVKIVVARDGSILSADLVKRSGDESLDRSVERALRAVTKLPPFPAGATDDQRSFLIRFNLDTKERSG
ncbi:MAG TPA: TonB family protein [Candidatus Saccharimonadales bacterium]|nr:TonB family protein [Candidatus Saccharimonadales bacterium]